MLAQDFLERIRPLVGNNSWDFIVLWKLSDDHRSLRLVDCICAGTQSIEKNGEEILVPTSSSSAAAFPCRDILFSHPRIRLPSSVTLDSGFHAEALLSNQSRWLNFSYNSDSNASEETFGTRVLVPLPLGLLELFATKEVPEDQQVINFIKIQCDALSKEQAISNSCCTDSTFSISGIHEIPAHTFLSDANLQKSLSIFQLQISRDSTKNSDLPHDSSKDRIHLDTSPFSPLQQFSSTSEIMNKNKSIFNIEGQCESDPFTPVSENRFHEMESTYSNMMSNSRVTQRMEPSRTMEMNEKIPLVEENIKSDDSDPNNDNANDGKYRKRIGKGHQAKNLEAERKRRRKLNDKLYCLRALVPNISKLDRAAILEDAINYVKELQKQAKDLQIELEKHSDEENAPTIVRNGIHNSMPPVALQQNGTKSGCKHINTSFRSGFHKESSGIGGTYTSKQNHDIENTNEKVQQMEPQVEVLQIDGNEFFVQVFCEHKPGGFVRLVEALCSLGLQVINVNTARHTCLVSNIFRVEKRDSETIQADHVKESLLELAQSPLRAWPDTV